MALSILNFHYYFVVSYFGCSGRFPTWMQIVNKTILKSNPPQKLIDAFVFPWVPACAIYLVEGHIFLKINTSVSLGTSLDHRLTQETHSLLRQKRRTGSE